MEDGETIVLPGMLHFKLSVDQYEHMIQAGILTENDRVELIRGELLDKIPIGDRHVDVVNRLNRKFAKSLDEAVSISVQNPIVLADSEPEPDVVLYTRRLPGKARASDVHLIIEVAETSLEFDRTVKLPLYAETGIREVWNVNLVDDCFEIFRAPQLDGSYRTEFVVRPGDTVAPLAFPGAQVAVADVIS